MPKQFDEDYQPKERKPRGKAKKTLIIDALKAEGLTEEGFWQAMVKKAMFGGQDGDGDSQMMREVGSRLFPTPKSMMPSYEIPFPIDGSMVEKADAIIDAVGTSAMPVDAAKVFMDIIASRGNIETSQELIDRITEIEKILEGKQ